MPTIAAIWRHRFLRGAADVLLIGDRVSRGAAPWAAAAPPSAAHDPVRRPDEARQVLERVYERFTEGFGTAGMKETKALRDVLQ